MPIKASQQNELIFISYNLDRNGGTEDDNGLLSNSANAPFIVCGKQFNSVEHLFQGGKCVVLDDQAKFNNVLQQNADSLPSNVKSIVGREYNFDKRNEFDGISSELMTQLMMMKISQNKQLFLQLLEAEKYAESKGLQLAYVENCLENARNDPDAKTTTTADHVDSSKYQGKQENLKKATLDSKSSTLAARDLSWGTLIATDTGQYFESTSKGGARYELGENKQGKCLKEAMKRLRSRYEDKGNTLEEIKDFYRVTSITPPKGCTQTNVHLTNYWNGTFLENQRKIIGQSPLATETTTATTKTNAAIIVRSPHLQQKITIDHAAKLKTEPTVPAAPKTTATATPIAPTAAPKTTATATTIAPKAATSTATPASATAITLVERTANQIISAQKSQIEAIGLITNPFELQQFLNATSSKNHLNDAALFPCESLKHEELSLLYDPFNKSNSQAIYAKLMENPNFLQNYINSSLAFLLSCGAIEKDEILTLSLEPSNLASFFQNPDTNFYKNKLAETRFFKLAKSLVRLTENGQKTLGGLNDNFKTIAEYAAKLYHKFDSTVRDNDFKDPFKTEFNETVKKLTGKELDSYKTTSPSISTPATTATKFDFIIADGRVAATDTSDAIGVMKYLKSDAVIVDSADSGFDGSSQDMTGDGLSGKIYDQIYKDGTGAFQYHPFGRPATDQERKEASEDGRGFQLPPHEAIYNNTYAKATNNHIIHTRVPSIDLEKSKTVEGRREMQVNLTQAYLNTLKEWQSEAATKDLPIYLPLFSAGLNRGFIKRSDYAEIVLQALQNAMKLAKVTNNVHLVAAEQWEIEHLKNAEHKLLGKTGDKPYPAAQEEMPIEVQNRVCNGVLEKFREKFDANSTMNFSSTIYAKDTSDPSSYAGTKARLDNIDEIFITSTDADYSQELIKYLKLKSLKISLDGSGNAVTEDTFLQNFTKKIDDVVKLIIAKAIKSNKPTTEQIIRITNSALSFYPDNIDLIVKCKNLIDLAISHTEVHRDNDLKKLKTQNDILQNKLNEVAKSLTYGDHKEIEATDEDIKIFLAISAEQKKSYELYFANDKHETNKAGIINGSIHFDWGIFPSSSLATPDLSVIKPETYALLSASQEFSERYVDCVKKYIAAHETSGATHYVRFAKMVESMVGMFEGNKNLAYFYDDVDKKKQLINQVMDFCNKTPYFKSASDLYHTTQFDKFKTLHREVNAASISLPSPLLSTSRVPAVIKSKTLAADTMKITQTYNKSIEKINAKLIAEGFATKDTKGNIKHDINAINKYIEQKAVDAAKELEQKKQDALRQFDLKKDASKAIAIIKARDLNTFTISENSLKNAFLEYKGIKNTKPKTEDTKLTLEKTREKIKAKKEEIEANKLKEYNTKETRTELDITTLDFSKTDNHRKSLCFKDLKIVGSSDTFNTPVRFVNCDLSGLDLSSINPEIFGTFVFERCNLQDIEIPSSALIKNSALINCLNTSEDAKEKTEVKTKDVPEAKTVDKTEDAPEAKARSITAKSNESLAIGRLRPGTNPTPMYSDALLSSIRDLFRS